MVEVEFRPGDGGRKLSQETGYRPPGRVIVAECALSRRLACRACRAPRSLGPRAPDSMRLRSAWRAAALATPRPPTPSTSRSRGAAPAAPREGRKHGRDPERREREGGWRARAPPVAVAFGAALVPCSAWFLGLLPSFRPSRGAKRRASAFCVPGSSGSGERMERRGRCVTVCSSEASQPLSAGRLAADAVGCRSRPPRGAGRGTRST